MNETSQLGFALLGLLHQQPMSGYDLRKVFTTTAMAGFSDSPGAIYPALNRLARGGLVRSTVEKTGRLRTRRVFANTPAGTAALKQWLRAPVKREDVIRGADLLLLRFAFMDQTLGAAHSLRFLKEFAPAIEGYITELRHFHSHHRDSMAISARLAFECGLAQYTSHLEWARSSMAVYQRRKKEGK